MFLFRRFMLIIILFLTACGTQATPTSTPDIISPSPITSNDSDAPGIIPQPPNSVTYVDGTNAIIDEILIGVNEGLDEHTQAGRTFEQVHFMTSPDDGATIINFFENTMDSYGWDVERSMVANQDSTPLAILTYPSIDDMYGTASISIFNLEQLHPTLDGSLIVSYVSR